MSWSRSSRSAYPDGYKKITLSHVEGHVEGRKEAMGRRFLAEAGLNGAFTKNRYSADHSLMAFTLNVLPLL